MEFKGHYEVNITMGGRVCGSTQDFTVQVPDGFTVEQEEEHVRQHLGSLIMRQACGHIATLQQEARRREVHAVHDRYTGIPILRRAREVRDETHGEPKTDT